MIIVGAGVAGLVIAALAVGELFGALDLVPTGARPSRAAIFGSVRADYKLALVIFAVLFAIARRYDRSRDAGARASERRPHGRLSFR